MYEKFPVSGADVALQIELQAKVQNYKETLADVRLKLNNAISRKKALADEIKALKEQRDQVLALFINEVKSKYPELAGKSKQEVLKLTDVGHPIIELYQKYHKEIQSYQGKLVSKINQYKSLVDEAQALEAEQYKILQGYEVFSTEQAGLVPSVQEISAQVVEPLPSSIEEDTKVLESASIIEDLPQDVADALLLQQAEGEAVDLKAEIPQAAIQPVEQAGFGKVWTIAGILALAYIFIGG